jgi:membrane protein YqaA with SNARE-associated domain
MPAAAQFVPRITALAAAFAAGQHHNGHLIGLLLSFGLIGVFLVSIVDSSFVPLPVPGVTDIMVIVLAAHKANLVLLVLAASAGSAIGGFVSYKVGHSGGMAFLEKHVPRRIFQRVCGWMQNHAILSVALPAVLPPPMPLSPFVLAAGALNMRLRTFMTAFTTSRLVRHIAAAWVGVHFGPSVLHIWNMFTRKYEVPILSVIWGSIALSAGFAFWRIWKTSREVQGEGKAHTASA